MKTCKYPGFRDESKQKVSFKWWLKWIIAKWHWRSWLRYEGMPREIKDVDSMHKWNKRLIKLQEQTKAPK